MDLSEFVQTIIDEVINIKCPDDNKVSVWTAISSQIVYKEN